MNTRLNVIAMTSAALLLSLAWTGDSMAQQRASNMPDPGMDRASCSEVDWHRDMLRDYPWVEDACHEAVVVDGKKWARFEAEFQRSDQDGRTITAEFKNDRGRSLGSVDLEPGPNQRVMLDGERTRFSDLRRGQVLNFYAPEGEFSFTTEPGSSDQIQVSQRRNDRDQSMADRGRDDQRWDDQRQDDQYRDDRSDRQFGQADRSGTDRQDRLPATAGPLPIIALGGLLSLLGGVTLSLRRRLTRTNA